MTDIVLINPRFQVSYWGLEHALPLLGKKCNLPTACLPLLAAFRAGVDERHHLDVGIVDIRTHIQVVDAAKSEERDAHRSVVGDEGHAIGVPLQFGLLTG